MTAASPPGRMAVFVRTVESYWRYAQALLAIVGEPRSWSNVQAGSRSSGRSTIAPTSPARIAAISGFSRAGGEYLGQSVTSLDPGNSATTRLPSDTRYT